MRFIPSLFACIAAGLLIPAPALASSLSAQEILQQFNLVTFGNVISSSQHVDGRTYIGGSVSGGDYVQHPGDVPPSAYAGLTVGGSATGVRVNALGAVIGGSLTNSTVNTGSSAVMGDSNNVIFNGPAYVAGSASGTIFNGGQLADPSLSPTLPTTTAAASSTDLKAVLQGLSQQLSLLADTGGTVDISGARATFNAVANEYDIAVFDLTAIDTDLFALGEFAFNLNGVSTVVFNTDESTYNIHANFLGGSAQAIGASAIWNFYNATDLTLNAQFGGAVLATEAELRNYNNIEGTVVADTLYQNGEIHIQSFTGNLPPEEVPEPGALALAVTGLLALSLTRGRIATCAT